MTKLYIEKLKTNLVLNFLLLHKIGNPFESKEN